MSGAASGVRNPNVIYSKKHAVGDSPTIGVPQDAVAHQIAISPIGSGTVGTATITIIPVGMTGAIPLYEADGSTPVVLSMAAPGDARSDIIGNLNSIVVTTAGFDGTAYKLSITSWFG